MLVNLMKLYLSYVIIFKCEERGVLPYTLYSNYY